MNRLLACALGLVWFVVLSPGQGVPTIPIDGHAPTIHNPGGMEYFSFDGAGNVEVRMPWKATYSSDKSAATSGLLVSWEITRTLGYNRVLGQYYPLASAEGVYSVSHGAWSGTTVVDGFQTNFWSWFGSRTSDEARYGHFKLKLSTKEQSGATTVVQDFMEWDLRPQDYASASSGNNSNGNNGTGTGSSGTDPGDTDGFWSNLFVPGADCVEDLKEAGTNLQNWGPFGWYGVISGRIQNNSETRVDGTGEDQYKISIPVPEHNDIAPGVGGTYELDLSPYQTPIKFIRAIFAFVMWYAFIFILGRKLYEKI